LNQGRGRFQADTSDTVRGYHDARESSSKLKRSSPGLEKHTTVANGGYEAIGWCANAPAGNPYGSGNNISGFNSVSLCPHEVSGGLTNGNPQPSREIQEVMTRGQFSLSDHILSLYFLTYTHRHGPGYRQTPFAANRD
jgi:hypothetical protein